MPPCLRQKTLSRSIKLSRPERTAENLSSRQLSSTEQASRADRAHHATHSASRTAAQAAPARRTRTGLDFHAARLSLADVTASLIELRPETFGRTHVEQAVQFTDHPTTYAGPSRADLESVSGATPREFEYRIVTALTRDGSLASQKCAAPCIGLVTTARAVHPVHSTSRRGRDPSPRKLLTTI
jgi:hypothetical protein